MINYRSKTNIFLLQPDNWQISWRTAELDFFLMSQSRELFFDNDSNSMAEVGFSPRGFKI